MNSTSINNTTEMHSISDDDYDDDNEVSFSSISTVSETGSSSFPLYTNKQLQFLLRTEKQKYCILPNETNQKVASWWRCFGFPAVINEKKEYEKIKGYISCTKCFRTSIYGSKSGTKRFIDHADRCSPLPSQSYIASNSNDSLLVQASLDKIFTKSNVNITPKDQNDLKELYAKWVCADLRPYSIVEDDGFMKLAQTFIRLGETNLTNM